MKEINSFLKNRLINLGLSSEEALLPLVRRAIYLTEVGVDSNDAMRSFMDLTIESKKLSVNLEKGTIKEIISSSVSHDDIVRNIVKHAANRNGLVKVAYPNPGLDSEDLYKEVNLGSWIDIVGNIYKDCKSGDKTKQEAIVFYSNTLDNEERFLFLRWLEHHLSGESSKYASSRGDTMEKKSVFLGDLGQGNSPYAHDGSGFYFQNRNLGNNMPGDSFLSSTVPEGTQKKDVKSNVSHQDGSNKVQWKRSLHAACRRIDKLLREDDYVDHEEYVAMAKLLLELSTLIKKVKLSSTAEDMTYRTASKLRKAGHPNHADALIKSAQDAVTEAPQVMPQESVPQAPDQVAGVVPEPAEEAAEQANVGPSKQEIEAGVSIPSPDDTTPVKLSDITPIPGPQPGEYDILAGDINLEDASRKLDEVAGMLADRRIIRQLAEFDIMLDKIGIASMFPELAESQSKLIDSFSYALTRVTKMMGQLSNAKSLVAANAGRGPGATPDEESPTVEQDANLEAAPLVSDKLE